jgi:predicted nucleic acid-binding Zn ribbon protein
MAGGKKRSKKMAWRNFFYLIMALILVGGLLLSAAFGLIDYFLNLKK